MDWTRTDVSKVLFATLAAGTAVEATAGSSTGGQQQVLLANVSNAGPSIQLLSQPRVMAQSDAEDRWEVPCDRLEALAVGAADQLQSVACYLDQVQDLAGAGSWQASLAFDVDGQRSTVPSGGPETALVDVTGSPVVSLIVPSVVDALGSDEYQAMAGESLIKDAASGRSSLLQAALATAADGMDPSGSAVRAYVPSWAGSWISAGASGGHTGRDAWYRLPPFTNGTLTVSLDAVLAMNGSLPIGGLATV